MEKEKTLQAVGRNVNCTTTIKLYESSQKKIFFKVTLYIPKDNEINTS